MLPKKERLTRTEFNRFFSVGRRFHSPSFQVVYVPYTTLHASVVVSKKNERRAVERNKIRRRIYDIVRHCKSSMSATGVFIFLVKSGVQKIPYTTLREEVHTIIKKIARI